MAPPDPSPLTPRQTWWLLATGIAACAPLAGQVSPWLATLAIAAFAWRATLGVWRRPLPTRGWLVAATLIGTLGVGAQYRTLFGQQAGIALLLVFMALKQLEARAPRDGLVIVLLAYFLTLARLFEDQSIPMALVMFGALLIATATLAQLADAHATPPALLKLAGTLLLQAVPFLLIFFVLFPRVQGPLWGLPADAHGGLTGLADSMKPGSINHLVQSGAIAFRVQFRSAVPARKDMYWRGPVLARPDGDTWRPGKHRFIRMMPYQPASQGAEYDYVVTLEPHNQPWLFALEWPTVRPDHAFFTHDHQLHARAPVQERRSYELRSRLAIEKSNEHPEILAEALGLPPELNPRAQKLGAGWTALGLDPSQRIQRAIEFMRDQRLTYTLRPPLMGPDLADEFLFDRQRGFCEHFAVSFVVLARAAGVPARIVTGYQGGEHNPVDDTWVVRQADAHAWAEVWLEERGWIRVDPTATSAPARIEDSLAAAVPPGDPLPFLAGSGAGWLRDLRFRWWAINNAWNQWVLGFNTERQGELFELLGLTLPDWRQLVAWLALASGLALALLTFALTRRRQRADPVERTWQRALHRLARRGLPRHPWEGPQDYARRIAREMPAVASDIQAIADLYAGLRYGSLTGSSLARLRQRVNAFKP